MKGWTAVAGLALVGAATVLGTGPAQAQAGGPVANALSGNISCPAGLHVFIRATVQHTGTGSWSTTFLDGAYGTPASQLNVVAKYGSKNGNLVVSTGRTSAAWAVQFAKTGGTFTRATASADCD